MPSKTIEIPKPNKKYLPTKPQSVITVPSTGGWSIIHTLVLIFHWIQTISTDSLEKMCVNGLSRVCEWSLSQVKSGGHQNTPKL